MGRETGAAGDAKQTRSWRISFGISETYEQKSNIKWSLENKNPLNNNTIDKYVSGDRAYIGQNTTSVPTSLTNASIGTQDSTIRPTFIPRIKSSEVSNSGKKYTFIQSAKGSGAEAISAKRQVNSLKMRSTTSLASKKSSVVHLLEKSTPAYNSRKYSITQFIPLDSEKSPNETIHITEILILISLSRERMGLRKKCLASIIAGEIEEIHIPVAWKMRKYQILPQTLIYQEKLRKGLVTSLYLIQL